MDLSYNDISNVHHSAFHGLTVLEKLMLNNNELTEMPYLGHVVNSIKELNLNSNPQIRTVNFSQFQMMELTTLELQDTGLTAMPISISNVPMITKLNLQSNHIKTITDEYFVPLHNLKELYISGNSIHELDPIALGLSDTLQILQADSIRLSNLTHGSFKNLQGCVVQVWYIEVSDVHLLGFAVLLAIGVPCHPGVSSALLGLFCHASASFPNYLLRVFNLY